MSTPYVAQYDEDFNTDAYVKDRYSTTDDPLRVFPLPYLYKFYKSLDSTSLRILDVGTGPCITYVISAAPYASEIVLSEYVEDNRKALQQWVDRDPKAFDWRPFLKHIVVDIEGGEEKDIPAREEKLRSSIKAIIPCDVSKDPVLPSQYMEQYDVVQATQCLECVAESKSDYVAAVTRLSKLLKPGGKLVLYHAEKATDVAEPAKYLVGSKWFTYFRLSKEIVTEALPAAGFSGIERVSTFLPLEMQHHPKDPKSAALYTATYRK